MQTYIHTSRQTVRDETDEKTQHQHKHNKNNVIKALGGGGLLDRAGSGRGKMKILQGEERWGKRRHEEMGKGEARISKVRRGRVWQEKDARYRRSAEREVRE